MIVKKQKTIEFINDCNCIVDYKELEKAIIWYQEKPTCKTKHIYIHSKYPCISIHNKKVHIHRLLMMYWNNIKTLETKIYVHHINGNKLDCSKTNLIFIESSKHQSLHNKGRNFSEEHKDKLIEANKKRKGKKYGICKKGINYFKIWELYKQGHSINKISKELKYGWNQVKIRIEEIKNNPDLLGDNNE